METQSEKFEFCAYRVWFGWQSRCTGNSRFDSSFPCTLGCITEYECYKLCDDDLIELKKKKKCYKIIRYFWHFEWTKSIIIKRINVFFLIFKPAKDLFKIPLISFKSEDFSSLGRGASVRVTERGARPSLGRPIAGSLDRGSLGAKSIRGLSPGRFDPPGVDYRLVTSFASGRGCRESACTRSSEVIRDYTTCASSRLGLADTHVQPSRRSFFADSSRQLLYFFSRSAIGLNATLERRTLFKIYHLEK